MRTYLYVMQQLAHASNAGDADHDMTERYAAWPVHAALHKIYPMSDCSSLHHSLHSNFDMVRARVALELVHCQLTAANMYCLCEARSSFTSSHLVRYDAYKYGMKLGQSGSGNCVIRIHA